MYYLNRSHKKILKDARLVQKKKLRLQQVREQEKCIATQVRLRVQEDLKYEAHKKILKQEVKYFTLTPIYCDLHA